MFEVIETSHGVVRVQEVLTFMLATNKSLTPFHTQTYGPWLSTPDINTVPRHPESDLLPFIYSFINISILNSFLLE